MGSRTFWLALVLTAGLIWGALRLLGVPFATGDFYPEYSSLRTDPLGSKLLYDGLARLPGLIVTRGYTPIELLPERDATVLVLGASLPALDDPEFLNQMESAARRGNRLVAALSYSDAPGRKAGALEPAWHIRVAREAHQLYFAAADGWTPLRYYGTRLVAVERRFGRGTVALFASSDGFTNQAMVMGRDLAGITAALGPNSHIIFDETHLGIAESGSVVGLARRYRLMGLFLGLAICTALVLWKHASPFPPPQALPEREQTSGRTSFAGLATLLRRHVPPADLTAACWEEWLKSNRQRATPEAAARAAAIVRERPREPLQAAREIQAVIHAKGVS